MEHRESARDTSREQVFIMKNQNIKAAVSLAITESGEIAFSKSDKVDDEIMKLFTLKMLAEIGLAPELFEED